MLIVPGPVSYRRRDSLAVDETTENRLSVQERIFNLQTRCEDDPSAKSSGYITPRMAKFK